jgi:FkbM family methyltransferase
MRRELLYNPRLLCERLALESINRRRQGRLHNTVAKELHLHDISSLELLELITAEDVNVIYDIGAHVGTWTLLAKAIFPSAQVHAFEPLAEHQVGIRKQFAGSKDVTLHPVALGSANTSTFFHVTDASSSSSVLPLADACRLHFGLREVEQIPIQLHRLDDYRTAHQLSLPDMIKLDVQGYELEALKGGAQCLRSAKAVLMEVSFVELYHGQPLFADVVRFMADHGFRMHAVSIATPVGKPLLQTDVLFLQAADHDIPRTCRIDG